MRNGHIHEIDNRLPLQLQPWWYERMYKHKEKGRKPTFSKLTEFIAKKGQATTKWSKLSFEHHTGRESRNRASLALLESANYYPIKLVYKEAIVNCQLSAIVTIFAVGTEK